MFTLDNEDISENVSCPCFHINHGFFRRFLPASATRGSSKPLGFVELCQLSSHARFRTQAVVFQRRRSHQAKHICSSAYTPDKRIGQRTVCNTISCKAHRLLQSLGHKRSSPCEANCAALDRGQLLFVTNLLTSLASLSMLRSNASSMSTLVSESSSCWSFVLA